MVDDVPIMKCEVYFIAIRLQGSVLTICEY